MIYLMPTKSRAFTVAKYTQARLTHYGERLYL